MYYVSTKGGGRGSAKCLRLLTGVGAKGSCLRNHSLEKMLNNLHQFFQGKKKSLESFYLCTVWHLEFFCTVKFQSTLLNIPYSR